MMHSLKTSNEIPDCNYMIKKELACIKANFKAGKKYLIRGFIFEATTILIFETQVSCDINYHANQRL